MSEYSQIYQANRISALEAELAKTSKDLIEQLDISASRRDEIANLKEKLKTAEAALNKVDYYWFDATGTTDETGCCGECDCGDSGRKTEKDGHDEGCIFNIVHEALQKLKGEK